jgi:hypothetical protein
MPTPPPPAFRYDPHWFWIVGSMVIPFAMLVTAVLGLGRGSFISTGVAAATPLAAVLLSLGVMCMALLRRRRVPIAIASAGFLLTTLGYWWLHWVS